MTIRRIYNKALYYKVPVRGVVRLKSRRRRKLKRGDTDVPVLRASMSLLAQYRIPLCITTSPVITIGALNNLSPSAQYSEGGDIQHSPVIKWVTVLGFDKAYHGGGIL